MSNRIRQIHTSSLAFWIAILALLVIPIKTCKAESGTDETRVTRTFDSINVYNLEREESGLLPDTASSEDQGKLALTDERLLLRGEHSVVSISFSEIHWVLFGRRKWEGPLADLSMIRVFDAICGDNLIVVAYGSSTTPSYSIFREWKWAGWSRGTHKVFEALVERLYAYKGKKISVIVGKFRIDKAGIYPISRSSNE